MITIPTLSILLLIPLIGALALILVPKTEIESIKKVAFCTSGATFIWSVIIAYGFDFNSAEFQFIEQFPIFSNIGFQYSLGIDGISIFLVLLTTLLVPLCLLTSWQSITSYTKLYFALFLILETFILGSFLSLNLILFYVFFEGVLVPMYFLIGIWGGSERIYAAFKFFLYTMLGSVLMLVGVLLILTQIGTVDLLDSVTYVKIPWSMQVIIWIGFFASFAVKVPMWPLHTWLPDAHVQAPTAASVILAGVLLKMGGYGFIRFIFYYAPDVSYELRDLIFVLSIIGIVYTSLVALVQTDMKKLIAYSSVAHMGVVTLGIFSGSTTGLSGALFHMISHGFVSGALFICIGVLYDRFKTREIAAYGGLAKAMPLFAIFFMIFTFATIGVPGTSGFIGELMVIFAATDIHLGWAAGVASGLILGAAYSLRLYRSLMLGVAQKETLEKAQDLNLRERIVFIPLVAGVLILGLMPRIFMDTLNLSAEKVQKTWDQTRVSQDYSLKRES